MPNIKSAKKSVLLNAKRKVENNTVKASMKTAIKAFEKNVKENNKELATTNLNLANKRIDKAVKAHVITANKAARDKSRLAKILNNME